MLTTSTSQTQMWNLHKVESTLDHPISPYFSSHSTSGFHTLLWAHCIGEDSVPDLLAFHSTLEFTFFIVSQPKGREHSVPNLVYSQRTLGFYLLQCKVHHKEENTLLLTFSLHAQHQDFPSSIVSQPKGREEENILFPTFCLHTQLQDVTSLNVRPYHKEDSTLSTPGLLSLHATLGCYLLQCKAHHMEKNTLLLISSHAQHQDFTSSNVSQW